jgi:predicted CopG family antitoxin
MKTIIITLDDKDYAALIRVKGDRTWREVLLSMVKDGRKLEAMK